MRARVLLLLLLLRLLLLLLLFFVFFCVGSRGAHKGGSGMASPLSGRPGGEGAFLRLAIVHRASGSLLDHGDESVVVPSLTSTAAPGDVSSTTARAAETAALQLGPPPEHWP